MKKRIAVSLALIIAMLLSACSPGAKPEPSEQESNDSSVIIDESSESSADESAETVFITEDALYDKLKGAWAGQMAGVVLGAKQEFWYRGTMMPDDQVEDYADLNINDAFAQDDLFVEITYIAQMMKTGYNSSLKQMADAFKNSQYGLDHANKIGRENLRKGIEAPDSGSFEHNLHCDDIDWQIDADFVAQLYPGAPNLAAARAFELGHITNYGDGVYGGVFVSAMNAAAYTAESVDEIIKAGCDAIPDNTKFKDVLNDVIECHDKNMTWKECWQVIQDKWGNVDRCPWYGYAATNIDAKLNSAYILIGLLYGDGDFVDSTVISMQCGQDSDCNPSSVGGILGTYYGFSGLPEKCKKNLDMDIEKFSATEYTLRKTIDSCFKLMKDSLKDYAAADENGYRIKSETVTAVPWEQWADMPTVEFTASVNDESRVILALNAVDHSGVKGVKLDMGDGAVFHESIASYKYEKAGKYTITLTVYNNNGNSVTRTETVTTTKDFPNTPDGNNEYRNLSSIAYPICTVTAPTGSGSMDLDVIRDGHSPAVGSWLPEMQYDTYVANSAAHDEYIGYVFKNPCVIDKLVFTEGMHFDNGGWFADGAPKLQVLVKNGDVSEWKTVTATVSPEYPVGNSQADFGKHFETYSFEFEEVECVGIRLFGKAGGNANFIGVSELEVYGVEK